VIPFFLPERRKAREKLAECCGYGRKEWPELLSTVVPRWGGNVVAPQKTWVSNYLSVPQVIELCG